MSVEPVLKGGGRADSRWGGAYQRGEDGQNASPIFFGPVRRGGWRPEPGGFKRDKYWNMVRSSRGERGVPLGDRWKKGAVGESEIEDRSPCILCKGKACIQPWLVEERVATLKRMIVVRMRQIVFSRIECAQGVYGRMVYVEVTHHQGRERVIREQGRWGESAKGGRLEGEVIGIGYPETGKLEFEKPSGAKISIDNKSERVEVTGRSETEFNRWGWT